MKTEERRKWALIATLIWLIYTITSCIIFQYVNAYFETEKGKKDMEKWINNYNNNVLRGNCKSKDLRQQDPDMTFALSC